MIRIGIGYDVHRLVEGRKLILGGVEIPHETGLLGHSDADVLLHSICDALLGSLALGDIGKHFPDTDEIYRGISSLTLLEKTYEMITCRGYEIVNVDAVIAAQAPKLAPYIEKMRQNIADALCTETENVSVKATTEEGLGFTGQKQGITANAAVLVRRV